MDKSSILFCIGALVGSALLAKVAYPLAAISKEQLTSSQSIVPAEELGVIDLGEFGEVSVYDMVSYYMDNPPEPKAAEVSPGKVRFEGC